MFVFGVRVCVRREVSYIPRERQVVRFEGYGVRGLNREDVAPQASRYSCTHTNIMFFVYVLCVLRVLKGLDGSGGTAGVEDEDVDCEFELVEASPCEVECPPGLESPQMVVGFQVSGGLGVEVSVERAHDPRAGAREPGLPYIP